MAEVRFRERSRNYVQEIGMQVLVVKCDICSRQMEANENRNIKCNLGSGIRGEKGRGIEMIHYKDICPDCSIELYEILKKFEKSKKEGKELEK